MILGKRKKHNLSKSFKRTELPRQPRWDVQELLKNKAKTIPDKRKQESKRKCRKPIKEINDV